MLRDLLRRPRPPRTRHRLRAFALVCAVLVCLTLLAVWTVRLSADLSAVRPWPGAAEVAPAAQDGLFPSDLSGLSFAADPGTETPGRAGSGGGEDAVSERPAALWAVQNSPGLLHRLGHRAGRWEPDASWRLAYADGAGAPDAEAVAVLAAASATGGPGVYVASERDNDAPDASSLTVLRYAPGRSAPDAEAAAAAGSPGEAVEEDLPVLTAAAEWDLTGDFFLPPEPNEGFEGIAFVPDAHLVKRKLTDETTGERYDPDGYGPHAGGVFFLAREDTGAIYGYVLEDSGAAIRITAVDSGLPRLAELEYEPDTGLLWAVCDDSCEGESAVLTVRRSTPGPWGWELWGRRQTGELQPVARYARPADMPDTNNEGFALAPATACADGLRPVYWADDDAFEAQALRRGAISCERGRNP